MSCPFLRVIRFEVGTASDQSDTILPTGSRVFEVRLEVLTEYSPGTTIEIGTALDPDQFMQAVQNDPHTVNTYAVKIDERVNTKQSKVIVTIGGAPVAGSSVVVVLWAEDVDT